MPKPIPKLLTKHCEPEVRQFLLSGSIKIGTLREFRNTETGTGAFSDEGEGISSTQITGDVHNATFQAGGNFFVNCSFVGNRGSAIKSQLTIEANAFCASIGPYSAERHRRLSAESANYKGNPKWTAHVVYNTDRLISAFQSLRNEISHQCLFIYGSIEYRARNRTGTQREIAKLFDGTTEFIHSVDAVFIKPELFAVEEEFRLGLIPKLSTHQCSTIWTRDFPKIMGAFRDAIEEEGSAGPRC